MRKKVNTSLSEKFIALQTKLQNSMKFFQAEYYKKISEKLSNPSTSPKSYWNLLKTFLNWRIFPVFHHFFT